MLKKKSYANDDGIICLFPEFFTYNIWCGMCYSAGSTPTEISNELNIYRMTLLRHFKKTDKLKKQKIEKIEKIFNYFASKGITIKAHVSGDVSIVISKDSIKKIDFEK